MLLVFLPFGDLSGLQALTISITKAAANQQGKQPASKPRVEKQEQRLRWEHGLRQARPNPSILSGLSKHPKVALLIPAGYISG